MASIKQSIASYTGGISQQPDQLKKPGQVKDVVNAIPDLIHGLYKRPGSKRVGTSKLANVYYDASHATNKHGSFFHYHRSEEEGSYIGQINDDGNVRIWKAEGNNPGAEQTVTYGTGGATAVKAYLATTDPENLQYLTLNDTTFVTNRSQVVAVTGTTAARPDQYFAFVDLLRTQNGRQYGLNVYSNNTAGVTINRATRVKITADDLAEGDGTGHCPGIGTQVFAVSAASSYGSDITHVKNVSGTTITTGKDNLIFRLTTVGQQGNSNQDDDVSDAGGFRCSYSRRIELLHGGEGWETGDVVRVNLTTAQTTYYYDVTIDKHEAATVKADIKAVRPEPTPFDAQTAVTSDTILGGIISELTSTGVTATIIGTGLYLTKSSSFSVETVGKDLMRVMQDSVNDISDLPIQCKNGYIVKVTNSRESQEDDYYLKFVGDNGRDGTGSWEECPAPGISLGFNDATMPHVIQRTSIANGGTSSEVATFTVKQFDYEDRLVGDDTTNPMPRFVEAPINQVLFFRNRIVFFSQHYIISSQPGSADKPNFFKESALATSAKDPIDIASSSTFPSDLFQGVETNIGLLAFSSNHQFLFTADDTILNPDTAKVKSVSVYNCNTDIPPLHLGTTIGFIDNSGKFSRFNEMVNLRREGEPTVIDVSKIIKNLLEKEIDLITNSRENGLMFLGKTDSDTVIGYKYVNIGDKRQQSSWIKWKFNNPIKYHFIINDQYFYLDTDDFLQSVNLVQASDDPSIDDVDDRGTTDTSDDITNNFLIHLDNYTTVSNGSYNAATKITTFTGQTAWVSDVTTPNGALVLVDTDGNDTRVGRYAECTLAGANFTVPGNWEYSHELSFAHTAVNASNEQITLTTGSTDHGLGVGDPVKFIAGTSTPGGLVDGTTYYVIDASINNIALASSASNATAGVAVNITSQGSGTHKIRKLITSLHIGYLYDFQVELPTIYVQKQSGESFSSDVTSSLVIHRAIFNFGKIGLYETTLHRINKLPYTQVYESTVLSKYNVSDAPYLLEAQKTIPIYEKNTNVGITLKSTHPSPATLISMSWEGDFSPKYYKRV